VAVKINTKQEKFGNKKFEAKTQNEKKFGVLTRENTGLIKFSLINLNGHLHK
jgi:hypothetical protein